MNPDNLIINGMRVIIQKPLIVANQKLSDKAIVTDEFRKSFDDWLMEFFGWYLLNPLKDGQIISLDGSLYMTQATYNQLEKEMVRGECADI